jgi:spermidine synthase
MDLMKAGWFSEINDLWPGVALSLKVEEILHAEESEFQKILVART